ncbi:MAG TPA: hypothetical protein DCP50_03435 [Exiguobacterium sp.]|nr:hypothetical protein [Exiguobacterium sp.]
MNTIETYGIIQNLKENPSANTSEQAPIRGLLHQYQEVIIKSLITSFGLDLLFIKDRHGGDVDTIHNVRAMQKGDSHFEGYANKNNQHDYEEQSNYDKSISTKYHTHKNYINRNREGAIEKEQGILKDAYTGNRISQNEKIDLDHVISAKEIQGDAGRILANADGIELANQLTNLKHTNRSINRSKGAKTTKQFNDSLDKMRSERQERIKELSNQVELDDRERKELNKLTQLESVNAKAMEDAEKEARNSYDKQLESKYYTSTKFLNDTIKSSYTLGMKMGLKQALGVILAEVVIIVKAGLPSLIKKMRASFDLKVFFNEKASMIKTAFKRICQKYKEIIQGFKDGILSGMLSSLTTTLINIFVTTAKNAVKIIRESFSTVVEALKILILNPQNLPHGEVMKAVAILISTGASVVLGTIVAEAMRKIPALNIPIVGDVLTTFVGASVTGLVSISLIYYIENSKNIKKIIDWLNQTKSSIDYKLDDYKKINEDLLHYVAKLEEIDLHHLSKQVEMTNEIAIQLTAANSDLEINRTLTDIVQKYNVHLSYDGTINGLTDFMNDPTSTLQFKL